MNFTAATAAEVQVARALAPFPAWTLLPFALLVIGIAALPLVLPHLWERAWAQLGYACACAAPVALYCAGTDRTEPLLEALRAYGSFVLTIAALYVVASGVFLAGDIQAAPRNNATFLVLGSLLASLIGTTGASILLVRPFLRTNRQRRQRDHLVPFFILCVSNAGGLLTPLGDPPLLIGYLEGVPFTWTFSLWPYIGNGPNLMVRAIAVRSGYAMPDFVRYAVFALLLLIPLHIGTTLLLLR